MPFVRYIDICSYTATSDKIYNLFWSLNKTWDNLNQTKEDLGLAYLRYFYDVKDITLASSIYPPEILRGKSFCMYLTFESAVTPSFQQSYLGNKIERVITFILRRSRRYGSKFGWMPFGIVCWTVQVRHLLENTDRCSTKFWGSHSKMFHKDMKLDITVWGM